MELTAAEKESNLWSGGQRPLNASYGKLMMWFFIVSDALTFSGFWFHMDFQDLKTSTLGPLQTKFLLISHFYTV